MDDLLREFLTETNESLDTVDNQLVRFEQVAIVTPHSKEH
jgi:two-component system, chemotaxis family, sensor kinase CheA